ncbi:MAG TPA: hypothetical protein VJG83_05425 [archaeon]|nr:hypothetical protein [archaeon]
MNGKIEFEKIDTLGLNLKNFLEEVKKNYRPFDPGNYLYKKLMAIPFDDYYSKNHLELIYVTLSAWNMNSRGAKLSEFEDFCGSIISKKNEIESLRKYECGKIKAFEIPEILAQIEQLFSSLKLVGTNKNGKEKPRLVTFSKTMHFLLPNLFMPIDRTYTLRFFYNNTNVPQKIAKQFEKHNQIFLAANLFAQKHNLTQYLDTKWNLNKPKIIDNLIIGHQRLQRKGKK